MPSDPRYFLPSAQSCVYPEVELTEHRFNLAARQRVGVRPETISRVGVVGIVQFQVDTNLAGLICRPRGRGGRPQ